MQHEITLTSTQKQNLSHDFQQWSKRVKASERKTAHPTYHAMYSWINGPTKLTLERLQELCDMMNDQWEVDGFKIFRVKEAKPADYLS